MAMVTTGLAALLVVALLAVLGAIVRFSIFSPLKTREPESRLREPDVAGVEALCGFRLPEDVAEFFRSGDLVSRTEVVLINTAGVLPERWDLDGFIPLTVTDVGEWTKITRVPGVPIATDFDKGAYYLSKEGSVRLQSPNVAQGDVLVAETWKAFCSFEVDASEELAN